MPYNISIHATTPHTMTLLPTTTPAPPPRTYTSGTRVLTGAGPGTVIGPCADPGYLQVLLDQAPDWLPGKLYIVTPAMLGPI